ncbi:hypothetical protein Droror1_Dr00002746 [Drosera rotundifolia]
MRFNSPPERSIPAAETHSPTTASERASPSRRQKLLRRPRTASVLSAVPKTGFEDRPRPNRSSRHRRQDLESATARQSRRRLARQPPSTDNPTRLSSQPRGHTLEDQSHRLREISFTTNLLSLRRHRHHNLRHPPLPTASSSPSPPPLWPPFTIIGSGSGPGFVVDGERSPMKETVVRMSPIATKFIIIDLFWGLDFSIHILLVFSVGESLQGKVEKVRGWRKYDGDGKAARYQRLLSAREEVVVVETAKTGDERE